MSLRSLIIENADVWMRGCTGESLSTEELTVFRQQVRAYHFKYLTMRLASLSASGTESAFLSAVNNVAVNSQRFPGSKKAWLELQSYTGDENLDLPGAYKGLVLGKIAELEEVRDVVDPSQCGS